MSEVLAWIAAGVIAWLFWTGLCIAIGRRLERKGL